MGVYSFINFTYLFRFVSISKNYRSVIRACMEELQQVAGIVYGNISTIICLSMQFIDRLK